MVSSKVLGAIDMQVLKLLTLGRAGVGNAGLLSSARALYLFGCAS